MSFDVSIISMNKIISTIISTLTATILLSNFVTASPNETELPLAGIAIQEKLKVPILYAAVFSDERDLLSALESAHKPMRMEVRYIQSKFSKRQNHQLWIERILINTPREELNKLSNELAEFSQLVKFEMLKGDQLVFDYHPTSGTTVYLNDVKIKLFKQFKFQQALSAIWFGKRPPNIIFKETLLKTPNPELVKAFNQLEFSNRRKREIASLFENNDSTKEKTSERAAPTRINKKLLIADKKIASITNRNSEAKSKKENLQTPNKKPITKKAKETTQKVISKKQAKKTPIAPNKNKESVVTDSSAKENVFDQILLELKDEYVADVKRYIESQARPVPPREIRKKPKSKAKVLVSFVEKNGTIVVTKTNLIFGEFVPEIVTTIHDSINKLRKIPLMPTPINDQELTVEVELSFSKCKRATSAWLCF